MSKYLLCGAALAALLTAPSADAADLTPSWGPAPYNWSGFYAGAVAGAAWGQYDPRTATVDDGYLDAADAAAVTAAGAQSIKTNGFVTGIEGGYNFQTGGCWVWKPISRRCISLARPTVAAFHIRGRRLWGQSLQGALFSPSSPLPRAIGC